MKKIIRYFITYPVWANVLMVTVLVIGFLSMRKMNTSFFPEVESNYINISIIYPGTSPQEIEESLVLKIENNLRGVAGIDRTSSVSRENSASVTVEVLDNYDADEVYDDVKNAVDRISPYPSGAEKPVIQVQKFRSRAVSVAIYGDATLWALKERARLFRDDLLAMDGISQVSLKGLPNREIAITLSEEDMRSYGLTFQEVAGALSSANLDISGGSIKTPQEEIRIRAYGRKDYAHQIRTIVLKNDNRGNVIRIGDVAQIEEQWEDSPDATYYNGRRAVIVNVEKTLEEDIIEVSGKVNKYANVFAKKHPEISVKIVSDATESLEKRINILVRNGLMGFILVIMVLGFFLNGRLSFWVAVGIPVSFAGMFIIANMWGITINVISLMGMIIVVGILVDDAIIVAESIYQKHEEGMTPLKASVLGVSEVVAPVFTAVMTTIIAFLPFFFFQGTMGRFIYQLALVVIGTLVFSLVESIFILPSHLSHSKGLDPLANRSRLRKKFDKFYNWLRDSVYGPALKTAINNKLVILAIPAAYILITVGLIKGHLVEFSAFPYIDRDDITLNLTMTTGTRQHVTDSVLKDIEKTVWNVNKDLKKKRKDKRDVVLSVMRGTGSNRLGDGGAHAGYMEIELLDGSKRGIPSFELQKRMRKAIGSVPGSRKLSFSGGHWGKAISISLLSNDLDQIDKAKNILKEELAGYPSLTDITDSDAEGWREVRIELKPEAYAAGLSVKDIAGQVRNGFFGYEVQRFQRGEDEIRLWVRYKEKDRASLGKLEKMYIRDSRGRTYPFEAVADYTVKRGRVAISHLDGKREVRVEADKVDPEASTNTIAADIKKNVVPEVIQKVRGVQVSFEGRARHNKKFKASLTGSYPFALIAIAVILVLVFRSPVQAVIIFIMIPLGLLGAVWGHMFHGFLISRLSTFGIIALAGIVINDSIVFIAQINRNLKNGLTVDASVYEAGLSRLRPIILTTVTTVAGMIPLLLETSRQAQFLIPMAVSLSYGLAAGSVFILFLVPVLFLSINRIRYFYAGLFDPSRTYESVEPAVRELASEKEAEEL